MERFFNELCEGGTYDPEQVALQANLGGRGGLTWGDLLSYDRVLIISEAGTGKTYECRDRQKRLWDAGRPAFFLDLAQLSRGNLLDLLSKEEESRFLDWLSSRCSKAIFFLDSFDELKLSLGSFEVALKKLAKAVSGDLEGVQVVVTTRPVPVDETLVREHLPVPGARPKTSVEADFARLAVGGPRSLESLQEPSRAWIRVTLASLSDEHIKSIAEEEGVLEAQVLLDEIVRRDAWDFYCRPLDLIELCADWQGGQRIRRHRDQIESNVGVKLKPRENRNERFALSPERARSGAKRLALAVALCRNYTIRHSAEADRGSSPDRSALDPAEILLDWSEDERKTLLERSIFGFFSYGRVRFHHRSVVEYLAAEHLGDLLRQGRSISSIKRILFGDLGDHQEVVKPSFRPLSAWLALEYDSIFEEILCREPELLLNFGDPESLSLVQRQKTLQALVKMHGMGGRRGLQFSMVQMRRFAIPDLGPEVIKLFQAPIENEEVRHFLLELIKWGEMTECAEVAFVVAMDKEKSEAERLLAFQAVVTLKFRMDELGRSLTQDSALWPHRLTNGVTANLVGSTLEVEVLCQVLARLVEGAPSNWSPSWPLCQSIHRAQISPGRLNSLRQGLASLVGEGLHLDPHTKSPSSAKGKLAPALAAVCSRQLREGVTDLEVLQSAVLAWSLIAGVRTETWSEGLEEALRRLEPRIRAEVWDAQDKLLCQLYPTRHPFDRYWNVSRRGPIDLNSSDATWVQCRVGDSRRSTEERAYWLECAKRIPGSHLDELRPLLADEPTLSALLEQQIQPALVRSKEELEDEAAAQVRELQERAALESWRAFAERLSQSPDSLLGPEHATDTLLNLWRAVLQADCSRDPRWADLRSLVVDHFGEAVAERLPRALKPVWRSRRPSLWSETPRYLRGDFPDLLQLGLVAISAEASEPNWAAQLSQEEAELALRYVTLEQSRLPSWVEDIDRVHPSALDSVLGEELSAGLCEQEIGYCKLLVLIKASSPALIARFLPRLEVWLDEADGRLYQVQKLPPVLELLVAHGDLILKNRLSGRAERVLNADTQFVSTDIWLPLLMQLNPVDAVKLLERLLPSAERHRDRLHLAWFALLFGGKRGRGISLAGLSPSVLLRLTRLAFQYICPSEDRVHGEEWYTPDLRDEAEGARSRILEALLSSPGGEGWAAKVELAEEQGFGQLKSYILARARGCAAEEVDQNCFSVAQIVEFCRASELPPLTRSDMLRLLRDRLEDLDDSLLRDTSPRKLWASCLDENTLRQAIARELIQAAREAYTVDQEAVTAEGKETDIRLRSTAADLQAVVELKIGDKGRSALELRKTLREQLVTKYLAAGNCRVGCLLISQGRQQKWYHPDTRAELDLEGLIGMLNEEARKLEAELGPGLHIFAHGLNLAPRLAPEKHKKG